MNYDNIIRFAFTHPDNKGKSIREVSRLLGMNPGSVHRILIRLGLVPKRSNRGFHPPAPPSPPSLPAANLDKSNTLIDLFKDHFALSRSIDDFITENENKLTDLESDRD